MAGGLRLAAGGLKSLLAALAPQGETLGAKVADSLMRYGPDVGFATYAALAAPGGPNPLVGLEDLGISLLGSAGGTLAGRAAGRRLARGLDAERAQERIAQAQQVGDLLVSAPLQIAAPRPALQAAIEGAYNQPRAQEQQREEAGQREIEEQLVAALLTSGGLGLGLGV